MQQHCIEHSRVVFYHTLSIAFTAEDQESVRSYNVGPALIRQLTKEFGSVSMDELHERGFCFVVTADFRTKLNITSPMVFDLRMVVPSRDADEKEGKVLSDARSISCAREVTEGFSIPPACTLSTSKSRNVLLSTDLYDCGKGSFNSTLFRVFDANTMDKGDQLFPCDTQLLACKDELNQQDPFWSKCGIAASDEKATDEYWVIADTSVESCLQDNRWSLLLKHSDANVFVLRKARHSSLFSNNKATKRARDNDAWMRCQQFGGKLFVVCTALKKDLEALLQEQLKEQLSVHASSALDNLEAACIEVRHSHGTNATHLHMDFEVSLDVGVKQLRSSRPDPDDDDDQDTPSKRAGKTAPARKTSWFGSFR